MAAIRINNELTIEHTENGVRISNGATNDIGACCRGADISLHVGEIATAKIEMFVTHINLVARPEVKAIFLKLMRDGIAETLQQNIQEQLISGEDLVTVQRLLDMGKLADAILRNHQ